MALSNDVNEKNKSKLQVRTLDSTRSTGQPNQYWRRRSRGNRECLEKEVPELKPKGLVGANHTKVEVRVYIKEAVCQELRGKTMW